MISKPPIWNINPNKEQTLTKTGSTMPCIFQKFLKGNTNKKNVNNKIPITQKHKKFKKSVFQNKKNKQENLKIISFFV